MLWPDRLFDPEPQQKSIAVDLYAGIKDLPIVSPHGHVDPSLFLSPDLRFGNPVELLVQQDHYVLRMLYSQGLTYQQLLSPKNPREIWRLFASMFHLFRGTPCGMWLTHEMESVFGVTEKLTPETADAAYDRIDHELRQKHCSPRALFERFNIELLATTDSASDSLEHHQAIRASGWKAKIIPTFRPDSVVNISLPAWRENVAQLSAASGIDVVDFVTFIRALEQRRIFFKGMGAAATDSGVYSPATELLASAAAKAIFQRALKGEATIQDEGQFTAHMLCELARMSTEDGLVMQIHAGVFRNHNPEVFKRFGTDRGFDLPVKTEFTTNLRPLLERFGSSPKFNLILFTMDESTYARELAPLAGAYPAVKLGPPWWFHDSWNGMRRYFDRAMETAGVYNTAGFNDDTRAFPSIPARHDVWRRASADWLAGLVARRVIDLQDAHSLAVDLAVGLAKKAYRLE